MNRGRGLIGGGGVNLLGGVIDRTSRLGMTTTPPKQQGPYGYA